MSDAPAAGSALPAIGRARRFEVTGGELWRLPEGDERIAKRLAELGPGVGEFVQHGCDADGWWLVRAGGGEDLEAWLERKIPWRDAVTAIAALAEAAAACEQRSLFPGALEGQLVARDGALEIRAESWVRSLVGETDRASRGTEAPKWMPPEAAGQPPDNASNRYAIGLVAYRAITHEHPFAGRGLRAGLGDQADRGAPPFAPDIAADVPPGLQSLCLRMLHPAPGQRPASAAEIARELRALLVAPAPVATVVNDAPSVTRPTISIATRRRRSIPALVAIGVPLVAGLAIAVLIDRAIDAPAVRVVSAAPAKPLASARELADCARCHPRQAAEWSRSVMAHAVESPLFQSLEILIEEQVGKDRRCPDGAGVLRAPGATSCTNPRTGIAITGSGGPGWCINCHAPGENIAASVPAWNALSVDAGTRRPLRDLLPAGAMEGISCVACHQMAGPTHPGDGDAGRYEGNPFWISADTGARFLQRPEDRRGVFGIANSGYSIDRDSLIGGDDAGGAHKRPSPRARAYQRSSEFCGACHDVRLFGTDSVSGEHFKRLRNAYSEWVAWSDGERRAGRPVASCQDCHMSLYPGICERTVGEGGRGCPPGTTLSPRAPGTYANGAIATGSLPARMSTHYFSGVDVPLARLFDPAAIDDPTLDVAGIPLGARQRRDQLLASAFRFAIDEPRRIGDRLEVPIVVENVGAGHRVPAGFSQEREIWVHLRVTDGQRRLIYEVGRVERGDEDLHDKVFLKVTTDDARRDGAGRPLGVFGADLVDGPDVPQWNAFGGASQFRGRGLINFQNGFLRCVRCIGTVDAQGTCQPLPGQTKRADRYTDGDYDLDTGECRSNLRGPAAFFEVYFPVGALDATRGILKGPDAIVDTRSLAPRVPARYIYDLDAAGANGPFTVEATLEFRAFPPFLIRAFAAYETARAAIGARPSGPLVDRGVLDKLDIVHVATARAVIR